MKSDLKREIGLRVKSARSRVGLTQEALADKVRRTVETVSKIERGAMFPSMDTLEALARALRTPVRDLLPDGEASKRSARRTALELQAANVLQALGDTELQIAVDQMKVLASFSPRKSRR